MTSRCWRWLRTSLGARQARWSRRQQPANDSRLQATVKLLMLVVGVALTAGAFTWAVGAQDGTPPAAQGSPAHPAVALLDAAGRNVLDSGGPVSTLATCGQCHDAAYIGQHNSHLAAANDTAWNPLLAPDSMASGAALPGGGGAEPECFLCHLARPDYAARTAALESGAGDWASTATLAATGAVRAAGDGWTWNSAAFNASGQLERDRLGLQDPADANCAQCHSAARAPAETPVTVAGCVLEEWPASATGQVFSAELVSASGLNLAGKAGLTRAWDAHAERGLGCTDCHYAPNNPVHAPASGGESLEHLLYDPRRLELGEYITRPSHDFTAGAQCAACHAAARSHDWLPYAERHLAALACETCHVPQVYAPALQEVDWTVLTAEAEPRVVCRGTEGAATTADLVTGYQPALLAGGEDGQLAPYNLVTAWYWTYDDASGQPRPVDYDTLRAAYFTQAGAYVPEVLAILDTNGSGAVEPSEAVLDQSAKVSVIAARLRALALSNPQVAGDVRPQAVAHAVATDKWALSDCRVCHTSDSRLAAPVVLAGLRPGGAEPTWSSSGLAAPSGLDTTGPGLSYVLRTEQAGRYVFGHNRAAWADWLGALAFLGVLLGVAGHGGLRVAAALRAPRGAHPATRRVYLYAVYERFWHWLQSFTIVLLLGTGLIIHRPDLFGWASFRHVVVVHNVLAAILVLNAALALFYHLASGEIRQYLPRPHGLFDQAIVQAQYYLRGIFRGAPHPFAKTPGRKLNPLQQVTYVAILNVLLPLQVVTGALLWGAQRWPEAAARVGGLAPLAAAHSLAAWLFGGFIVAHIYLTTTGHTPLAGINAMIGGWEDVETPASAAEATAHDHIETDTHASGAAPAAAPEPGAA